MFYTKYLFDCSNAHLLTATLTLCLLEQKGGNLHQPPYRLPPELVLHHLWA
jgi:hypothetical protein